MKPWLIPAILLCFLLIVPAMAQTVTITAPEGKAIKDVTIGCSEGTHGTATFGFNDDTSMSGSWSYVTTSAVGGFSLVRVGTVEIGGETATTTFVSPGRFYITFWQTKEMVNMTSNTMRGSYGQLQGWYYNYVETVTPASPVISMSFTADTNIEYDVEYIDLETASNNVSGNFFTWINQIVNLGISSFAAAYGFLTNLLYWLKFFFVDNLGLIIVLYISVSMALAARAARGNIGRFYSRFITQQVKLIQFIFEVWRMLIESIGTIRGWFRV